MFQFPGFPPIRYGLAYGCTGCSCTGCPIQKSADQWLCAPPRGLSQLVTSFIGSWCQGIRPVPFLLDPPAGTSVYPQDSFDSLLKIDVFLSSVFLEPRGSSENRLWNSENYFQIYTRMQFSRCSPRLTTYDKPVGLSGLEPPTSRLSGVRSNLLSYKPV